MLPDLPSGVPDQRSADGNGRFLPVHRQAHPGSGTFPVQANRVPASRDDPAAAGIRSGRRVVGRYADYILRDRKDVLNVFIHADMAFKKKRCMERGQFSDENADERIRRRDKLRADHYRYYTDQKWGDSLNYHLCLDSGIFGIEKCVSMIEDACKGMRNSSRLI